MLDALQNFTESFPTWLQWLGVMAISAIPFVESYFGSIIGVAAGINPVVAVAAAIAGNVISMLFFVLSAKTVRKKVTPDEPELTPRQQRLRKAFDKYGVPGVSLLGQTMLPSQITSAAMVGFGASRNAVIFWQIISICIWGILCGVLAAYGFGIGRG